MKTVLLLVLFLSTLMAEQRPKIALVLSGGGARGGAHVGVLKILEENHVPIDMIIGTSMGSFVGGLYASGMSPDEIGTMLETTDWEKYIRSNFDRADTPMRKKDLDYTYQGRVGLGINAENELVLPTGVLKRQPMLLQFMELTQNVQDIHDFDKLSIPFRAVATNIKNGDTVVLKSGNLAKAIYASSAIPGGFQPININGIDLVDGGVSDNIPINIAQEMGADIIIAVDVSENFSDKLDVNSYFVVMGQLVNILMRKNANESIETLSKKDILITPDLTGYGGLDAHKYKEIIATGSKAAKQKLSALCKLSLSDVEYKKYVQIHRKKHTFKAPIIDKIVIDNPTYLSNTSIRNRIHQKTGEALDLVQLREDLIHLYNMMIFDSVDYRINENNGKNILIITTVPSWDNHGEVRLSIGLEDDFSGHSAYSLKLGYTMFGLNSYGGEWRSDFEIGRYKKARTELFQPLDTMQRYYIKPSLEYSVVDDIFPLTLLDETLEGNHEMQSGRYGGSFAIGAHFSTDYEIEMSLSAYKDNVTIKSYPVPLPGQQSIVLLKNIDLNYDARPLQVVAKMDNLDNVNFPTSGLFGEIRWIKEMVALGSDYDYEQIYVDIEKPLKFYSNNITFYGKYGNTYKRSSVPRLAGTFTLGGLFNLSGYVPYSTNGDNMVLGVLRYSYEIKDGGFFGTLNAPLYAGFSLEIGDTWDNGVTIDYSTLKKSASIYLAADTFLGPFYLAYGYAADGQNSAYLYLGEKF